MNLEHMCVSLPFVVCLYLLPHSHCSSFSLCVILQGVKPASFDKVAIPEVKEIIEGCIQTNKDER